MTIVSFLNKVNSVILNPIITLAFAIATIYFIYGIVLFIGADGKDREKGRNSIMWGLVGMFIMFSVYGIINLILKTFEINDPKATSYIQQKL